MKRSYRTAKENSRRTLIRQRAKVVGGLVALVLVSWWLLPSLLAGAAVVITTPFFSLQEWLNTSSSDFPRYWQNRSELISKIHDLERELANQDTSQGALRGLEADNVALRALLSATTSPRIAAVVTHGPTQIPHDQIMIDRGSRDGIKVGAPVYYGNHHVIGIVNTVFPRQSLITLISASDFTSTVYVLGPDIYTTATGQGGGVVQVAVPQGIPLSESDILLLPTIAGGVIGEVSLVRSEPTEPNQYGYVTLPVPRQSLRYVAVGSEPLTSIDFATAVTNVDLTVAEYFSVPVPAAELIAASTTATSSAVVGPTATSSTETAL